MSRSPTSCLLATIKPRRWQNGGFRERSTAAYKKTSPENRRRPPSRDGSYVRYTPARQSDVRLPPLPKFQPDVSPFSELARSLNRDVEKRKSSLGNKWSPGIRSNAGVVRYTGGRDEEFSPAWLLRRLEYLANTTTDSGYSAFLRSLESVLQNKRLLTGPEEEESDWKPREYSKPWQLVKSLRTAHRQGGKVAVDLQLQYSYNGLVADGAFSKLDVSHQESLADLRYPVEWYPGTRAMQRTIHLHVGPTNSGKTYHALQALEQAKSGIYAGPLRLLAHEVFSRLNAKGILCDLVTGDERVIQGTDKDGSPIKSCTVEMVPMNRNFEVGIIDEIQMIGSKERGWAWTQALLGLRAKQIHLTGEERTVPLIRELVASMGDKLEVHNYKRLSPLKTMSFSLDGRLTNLRKGDCVVVFSRVGILEMRTQIEKATQKRVAIVYGSLPPEIRAQQAQLFNEPDNDYDFLVASDAIGMGLNLAVKRIIFASSLKFDGFNHVPVDSSHLKQIAGRAGRFRTAADAEVVAPDPANGPSKADHKSDTPKNENEGLVTTLYKGDLPLVRRAMTSEAEPIMSAGLLPPTHMIVQFAAYFPPSTSFSYILLRLQEISHLLPRYHFCSLHDHVGVADIIQPVKSLTTENRITFCVAPVPGRDKGLREIVLAFARCVGESRSGELLDIPEIPLDVLDQKIESGKDYMYRLESLHKALILYLWLSYRFPGTFTTQDMAFHVKRLVEERLDAVLAEYSRVRSHFKLKIMERETLRRLETGPGPQASHESPEMLAEADEVALTPEDSKGSQEQSETGILHTLETATSPVVGIAPP